jgi:RNA polymerase sigma-70 factor (ECF subfamily)
MNTSAPKINLAVVRRARNGDDQAFAALYDIWVQPIYNFIFRRVKTRDTAQDLAADVFLRVWKNLPDLEISTEAKFRAWLYRIARNTVIDHYRTQETHTTLEEIAETPSEDFGVDIGLELSSRQQAIEKCLTSLAPEYQKVLRLRYFEELPISKVAMMMRKKEGAIRTLTHRALKELKVAMGEI